VIVSGSFARHLTGEPSLRVALQRMGAKGPALVAATLGAGGALACERGALHFVPSIPVPVVDTTSAGDLFHAGCLYGLLRGWGSAAAAPLRRGRRVARMHCPRRPRGDPEPRTRPRPRSLSQGAAFPVDSRSASGRTDQSVPEFNPPCAEGKRAKRLAWRSCAG